MRYNFPFYPLATISMLAVAACSDTTTPSQPDMAGNTPSPTVALATASNTWTRKASILADQYFGGYSVGMAPDAT